MFNAHALFSLKLNLFFKIKKMVGPKESRITILYLVSLIATHTLLVPI